MAFPSCSLARLFSIELTFFRKNTGTALSGRIRLHCPAFLETKSGNYPFNFIKNNKSAAKNRMIVDTIDDEITQNDNTGE